VIKGIFLANGSSTIGMGHIMRCIAVAEKLKAENVQIEFLTKYEQGQKLLLDKGFKVSMYFDEKEILDVFNSARFDFAFIDTYEATKQLFQVFKAGCKKVIYLDDLNAFDYPVDMVINTSINARELNYPDGKKYLLGTKYCILRQEFEKSQKILIKETAKDIFITTGGSDRYNMTYKLLKALAEKFKGLNFHTVIGQAFSDISDILSLKERCQNIKLYFSPSNMAELMEKCDIAISAGGNTLYELSSLGIPALAFIYANNQIKLIQGLEKAGCIENIGFYDKIEEEEFLKIFRNFLEDYNYRKKISENQTRLIDLKGTQRICENIFNLLK